MTELDLLAVKMQIADASRDLLSSGLSHGKSGNISVRAGRGILVTPTGVAAEDLSPDDISYIGYNGQTIDGLKPSSEWYMHAAVYASRADVQAIVHCHSRFSTLLACAGKNIPAVHYMVAQLGGSEIPLAPYARFGSKALANHCLNALGMDYKACLLANHGQIALGKNLSDAFANAQEVEQLAAVYYGTLSIGGPKLLSDTQMQEALEAFADYGQQNRTLQGSEPI